MSARTSKRNATRRQLGPSGVRRRGVPFSRWVKQSPDAIVRRGELMKVLSTVKLLERRARAAERERAWFRRFWRWLTTPITGTRTTTPTAPTRKAAA